MNPIKRLLFILFILIAVGVTACVSKQDAQTHKPNICGPIAEQMTTSQGINVETEPASLTLGDRTLAGCRIEAEGTGVDFAHIPDIGGAVVQIFQAMGWQDDMQFASDGPFSTGGGFRSDEGVCLFEASWGPADDVDCPQDQPVSACDFGPEETHVVIQINCGEDTIAE